MVRPNDQAEDTDTRHGVDHPDGAKHGLSRKGGDHVADQTKGRQDEDVNLGVAKKPEQVHIEHRVPTSPWVEGHMPTPGSMEASIRKSTLMMSTAMESRTLVMSTPHTNRGTRSIS